MEAQLKEGCSKQVHGKRTSYLWCLTLRMYVGGICMYLPWICACVHADRSVCMYTCILEPEVYIKYLPHHSLLIFFKAGSPTESGAHQWGDWLVKKLQWPACLCPHTQYQGHRCTASAFYLSSGALNSSSHPGMAGSLPLPQPPGLYVLQVASVCVLSKWIKEQFSVTKGRIPSTKQNKGTVQSH